MKYLHAAIVSSLLLMSSLTHANTLMQEVELAIKQATQEALAQLVAAQKKSIQESVTELLLQPTKAVPNDKPAPVKPVQE
ncbi:hypothetical protein [Pseudoalteromonas sp. BDTF-M6]|uniref:hypothetical protein n=1 Tax=Pseudoalteromonas sp. BDTF-M6 TaxID=2796132 RepID=UPI001BAF712C|nr:hypothetical protein [Pseudoalteromonas sp. BDTF-M6]MBS3797465.1 hypothetical protein [Pseudoalteromonas sp. BDTF-M6]